MEGWGENKVEGVGCEKIGCVEQKKVEGHSSCRPLWGGKRLMAKKKKMQSPSTSKTAVTFTNYKSIVINF